MKKVLAVICFICAVLCIVYFGVIIGYSGLNASFSYAWLCFTLIFALMGSFLTTESLHKDAMPHFLPTFIYTTFCLAVAIFSLTMGLVITTARSSEDKKVDYCIVMGARVFSNGISKTLMYRLDEAYDIYSDNGNTVLVLSGGQARGDAIPEAFAMYNYLSMRGVPHNHMFVEPKATSTVGIIENAANVIMADTEKRKIPKGPGDKTWDKEYEPRVGIITSDYHMFRSLALAEEQGIKNTVGIPAKSDTVLFVHNCVRESAEIIKDFLMGNVTIDEAYMPELPFNRE